MKKIGIIGGGISGLTASYKATKKGYDTVLFEESSITGGRLEYCVSLTSNHFQPHLYNLIKELDMEELSIPFSPKSLGMYVQGKVAPYSSMMKMIEEMPEDASQKINGLIKEAMESDFTVDDPSDNLKELRKISFAEYLKDFPKMAIQRFIMPMMVFTFKEKINLENFSAEYGLFQIRFGMEMAQDNVSTLEEGVRILSDILEKESKERGAKIRLSTEVEKVEKTDKGFKIYFTRLGEKGTIEVENVLFAVPLNVIKEIFPEIEISDQIDYGSTKCLIGEGKLKTDKKMIMGTPANEQNLRFLFQGPYGTQYIYPYFEDKKVDLDAFYKDIEITQERTIENAFALLGPGADLPKVETNVKNAYLCSDYYYYPLIETSIVTAKKAVEKISS